MRTPMNPSIVDVNRGEEDPPDLAGRKREGHRVDTQSGAASQAEHDEAMVTIEGQAVPDGVGQSKARVETLEVPEARYEGRIICSDLVHSQRRVVGNPQGLAEQDTDPELLLQITEEIRVTLEGSEPHGIFTRLPEYGQGQHHCDVRGGRQSHLIDEMLAATVEAAEEIGFAHLVNGSREDTHGSPPREDREVAPYGGVSHWLGW